MATLTISLPNSMARRIDQETKTSGFSTRSEFIRSLLRRYFSNELRFEVFTPRPLPEIQAKLEKTGKYNQKFISGLMKGLSESPFYAS